MPVSSIAHPDFQLHSDLSTVYRRLSHVIEGIIWCLNIQNTSELSRPRHLVLFLGKKPKEPWRGRSNLRWDMVHLSAPGQPENIENPRRWKAFYDKVEVDK